MKNAFLTMLAVLLTAAPSCSSCRPTESIASSQEAGHGSLRQKKWEKQIAKKERELQALKERANRHAVPMTEGRQHVSSVYGVDKELSGAAIDGTFRVMGRGQLTDVTVAGNCSVAGDADFYLVTVGGGLNVAGDIALERVTVQEKCSLAGDCTLRDVRVQGKCSISGDARVQDVQVGRKLSVTGKASLQRVRVDGDISFGGKLIQFDHCSCKELKLKAPGQPTEKERVFRLTNADIGTIRVEQGSTWHFSFFCFKWTWNSSERCKEVRLILEDTTVAGDIEFVDIPEATVVLGKGATVNGQVIGAKVVKQ